MSTLAKLNTIRPKCRIFPNASATARVAYLYSVALLVDGNSITLNQLVSCSERVWKQSYANNQSATVFAEAILADLQNGLVPMQVANKYALA